jgi:hypothetical protein
LPLILTGVVWLLWHMGGMFIAPRLKAVVNERPPKRGPTDTEDFREVFAIVPREHVDLIHSQPFVVLRGKESDLRPLL